MLFSSNHSPWERQESHTDTPGSRNVPLAPIPWVTGVWVLTMKYLPHRSHQSNLLAPCSLCLREGLPYADINGEG